MSQIRVGIADDHSLFREGIRMILSGMENIVFCLEANSGEEVLKQMKTTPIDVLLLDIDMPGIGGIEALKQIQNQPNRPKVIMLSMHVEARMISYMLELGASSYLLKDVRKEELEMAIRMVNLEGQYLSEIASKAMLSAIKSKSNKPLILSEISQREVEILGLICHGFSTKEIGDRLHISERTVEGHRKNLFDKLEVKNVAGLVMKALSLKLIDNHS
jgi:DNA-binding NarL/FixJ family response regulator